MIADHATSRSDSAVRSSRIGEQREARHGAGALRRHRRAGERGVEQRRQQREHGGDLLGIDAQRQRRHQRDAVADQAHHQADDEHDVQARDRQDVRQARIAHRLGDVLVDRGLLAGQQGRDHAALGAGQRLHDALGDVGAQRIDGAHDAGRACRARSPPPAPAHSRRRRAAGTRRPAGNRRRPARPVRRAARGWPAPGCDRRRAIGGAPLLSDTRSRTGIISGGGTPLPFSRTASSTTRTPSGRRWMSAMRPSTLMLNKGRLSVGAARLAVRQVDQPEADRRRDEADRERAREAAGRREERPGRARRRPSPARATAQARSAARNRPRCPGPSPPAATASSGRARRRADPGSRCVPPSRRLPSV